MPKTFRENLREELDYQDMKELQHFVFINSARILLSDV